MTTAHPADHILTVDGTLTKKKYPLLRDAKIKSLISLTLAFLSTSDTTYVSNNAASGPVTTADTRCIKPGQPPRV